MALNGYQSSVIGYRLSVKETLYKQNPSFNQRLKTEALRSNANQQLYNGA